MIKMLKMNCSNRSLVISEQINVTFCDDLVHINILKLFISSIAKLVMATNFRDIPVTILL